MLTWASRGHGSLVLLPVLCEGAFFASRRRVVLFALLASAFIVAAHRQRSATTWQAVTLSAGHLAGVLFVVALALLLRSERDARAQGEVLAAARERTRIAREVHDTLGHALTAAQAQLAGALAVGGSDLARMEALVRGATMLVDDSLLALRQSVSALREAPSLVLLDAARALLDQAENAGLRTTLRSEGAPFTLPVMVTMALYRSLQECITNTLRHAGATQLDVTLHYASSRVTMHVHDNGHPIAPLICGAGLRGIEERVVLLGGDLTVSPLATGFAVRVSIATNGPSM